MFSKLIIKNVVGALAVGGVLAVSQFASPAVVTSSPAIAERAYPASVVTNTDLTLDRTTVRPGQRNTARVTVSSDDGTPQGTVTFRVSGHDPQTVTLVNGKASYDMPTDLKAGRTYTVTATYNGNKVYKKSSDSENVTVEEKGKDEVKGREGERERDGNGNGSAGSGSGDSGSSGEAGDEVKGVEAERDASGDLPATGSDENTQLYALGGLALLLAGGASLLIWRRRTH